MTENPGKDATNTDEKAAKVFARNSLPALSLPKGGGAIRGMGEKFAATPVTGASSISVPFAVSPSRAGFGPQLNLAMIRALAMARSALAGASACWRLRARPIRVCRDPTMRPSPMSFSSRA
jgi:hypothetical protein